MKIIKSTALVAISIAFLMILGSSANTFAQGNSGNSRKPAGNPNAGRTSGNQGSTTNTQRPTERRENRNDDSNGSNTRRDSRTDRERKIPNEDEINRFKGIAKKLDTTPEILRSRYEASLINNPDLKFGQFVAANVVADNLGEKYPNVTTSAILGGLENGDSIGKTLKNLGVSKDEANRAQKEAKRRIEKSREQ